MYVCVCVLVYADKVVFIDIIVEDDSGETEKPSEVVPYQLTKEAVVMDLKVKDIKVCVQVYILVVSEVRSM